MKGVFVVFDDDYEKNSRDVEDKRVFKVVERKFNFLRSVGLRYPSLNAKQLSNMQYDGKTMWEFYITKKWRCLFTYEEKKNQVTVLKICNHL